MALSDYLTDDEWDACFYANVGPGPDGRTFANFGDCMHAVIDAALATGYRYPGLTDSGEKRSQLASANPLKICIWLGNPHDVYILGVLKSGREWMKTHLPAWVTETDEEWAEQIARAEAKRLTPDPIPSEKAKT